MENAFNPTKEFSCNNCEEKFSSRNKLFKHVRAVHTLSVTDVKSSDNITAISDTSPKYSDRLNSSSLCSFLSEIPPHFVYVIGGRLRGRTLNAVHRYSSFRQQWEVCPGGRMIENRGSHGATTVNNVLYVVGGGGLHSNLFSCEKFDGTAWQSFATLNVSRHALAVTTDGDSIYAVGGWIDGVRCSPASEIYDIYNDEWENLPQLNIPRKLHGCAALHGKLYVFGGSCDEPLWHTDTAEVLDIAAAKKEIRLKKDKKRNDIMSEYCSSEIAQNNDMDSHIKVVVQTKEERRGDGGVVDTRRSTTADYRPFVGSDNNNIQWQLLTQRLPRKGGGTSAVTVHGRIYVFFHGQGGGVCWYDPHTDKYSELNPLPVDDWHCFDVTPLEVLNSVYVIGGTSRGVWSKVAYMYNTLNDSWQELPPMPQAKRRVACSVILDMPAKKLGTLTNV